MSSTPKSSPDSAAAGPGNDRLDSWKEIAAFFRRDESTVRRWEKDGLPVHRRQHKAKATVFAYRSELDAWWRGVPVAQTAPAADSAAQSHHRKNWAALAVGVVSVVLVAVLAMVLSRSAQGPSTPVAMSLFMSSQGELSYPSFSPDGTRLAFTWVNPQQSGMDVYVKAIGSEAPLRLTHASNSENFAPQWSPDGSQIAFLRRSAPDSGIFVVPAAGGIERKVVALRSDRYYALDWSPDGKRIALARRETNDEPYRIFLVSLADGHEQQVSFPPPHIFGDARFAISPNGKDLVLIRHSGTEKPQVSIELVSLAAPGTSKVIASYSEWVGSLAWSSDGRSVVLSGNVHGIRKLWRVYISDGRQELLNDAGENVYYPAAARRADRMAFVREIEDADLWQVELSSARTPVSAPVRVNFSTRVEGAPRFSPDGKRVAFMSYRSGLPELWVSDPDGNHPMQVTAFGTSGPELPSWSPDGHTLVFAGGGPYHLVDTLGGKPRALSAGLGAITYPSWSRDGSHVYFCRSGQGGVAEIWKATPSGGPPVLVVKSGISSMESPDGKVLYFTKGGVQGIWRMPVKGGNDALVLDRQRPDFPGYWAVVDDGIFFLDTDPKSQPTIEFFNFLTRRTTRVVSLTGLADPWRGGLTVSPNGRSLMFSQQQYSSYEIVVSEHLH